MANKVNEFGDPVDEFGDPIKQESSSPSMEGLNALGQKVGEGVDFAKKEYKEAKEHPIKYAKEVASDLGPSTAAVMATAMLGPEAGYPAYMVTGGLTQGGARAIANKLEGKPAFNEDTAVDAVLGSLGSAVQKPLSIAGEYIGKNAALTDIGRKLSGDIGSMDATAKELTKDILNKRKVIGPEVRQSLENWHSGTNDFIGGELDSARNVITNATKPNEKRLAKQSYGEVNKHLNKVEKLNEKMLNLSNKTPEQVFRMNSEFNPELAELQNDVALALRRIEPAGTIGKYLGSYGGGAAGRSLLPSVGRLMEDKFQKVKRGK